MEMYCFNSDVLDGLLRSVAPSFPKDGETVMAGLTPLLHRLFAIRATNIDLQLGLKWLDSFEKSCSIKGHSIEFNEDDFVTRYLGKNAQLETKQRFIQRLGEISAKLKATDECLFGAMISQVYWRVPSRTFKQDFTLFQTPNS